MIVVSLVLAALVAGAAAYSVLAVIAARRYLSAERATEGPLVPVSVLKPLAGAEDELEENLRSFFEQDYPEFELIFAVRERSDPACRVVERLQAIYPDVRSRLLVTGEPPYPNAKVFSLACMARAARYDLLVMSDSDIRARPDMLRSIASEFGNPRLGMLTCPYRAVPGKSFWSRLEALGMNTDFWAGVLAARLIEGMHFAVGPTTAARRQAIEDAGGFESLKDFLAEDFVLGARVAGAGWLVELSRHVVEHHIGSQPLGANFRHRLRWVRSTRRSRPAGYVGQIFTYPVPLLAAALAWAPGWWPAAIPVLALRALAAAAVAGGVLSDPLCRKWWWLIPVEDLLSFMFWVAGFFGDSIEWRGRRYRLLPDGRFELQT